MTLLFRSLFLQVALFPGDEATKQWAAALIEKMEKANGVPEGGYPEMKTKFLEFLNLDKANDLDKVAEILDDNIEYIDSHGGLSYGKGSLRIWFRLPRVRSDLHFSTRLQQSSSKECAKDALSATLDSTSSDQFIHPPRTRLGQTVSLFLKNSPKRSFRKLEVRTKLGESVINSSDPRRVCRRILRAHLHQTASRNRQNHSFG